MKGYRMKEATFRKDVDYHIKQKTWPWTKQQCNGWVGILAAVDRMNFMKHELNKIQCEN